MKEAIPPKILEVDVADVGGAVPGEPPGGQLV